MKNDRIAQYHDARRSKGHMFHAKMKRMASKPARYEEQIRFKPNIKE